MPHPSGHGRRRDRELTADEIVDHYRGAQESRT
jgi:hypothetical protein